MSHASVGSLGADCLPFFGKVAAGQCHEVVNVLNVINEQAGLIADLSSVAEPERIAALAGKIQAQVQRGQGLVRSISRFAHSTDAIRAVVDAGELLRDALALLERPVRLAGSRLHSRLPEGPVVLETGPFLLLRLVCAAVELWVAAAPARIELDARAEAGGLRIRTHCPVDGSARSVTPAPAGLAALAAQVQALGGALRAPDAAASSAVEFWIPGSAAGSAAAPDPVA